MSCAISQAWPALVSGTAGSRPLPRALKDFRGYHAGETILVCGCGSSLSQLISPERFITIGVNDVGRLFQPDYLVVLNPKQQFREDRFRFVEESRARAIFTQLSLGINHPHIVRIRLGKFGGVDFSDPNSLHYTRNSPYLALCLAVHMGARRIGLIGIDFTDDHFFARTGQHPLFRELPRIDQEYKRLYDACLARGVEVLNLSSCSRLTAFPKLPFEQFTGSHLTRKTLQMVSYATTPVAGVPAILSRCIAARTRHSCRTLWATNSYGNGVDFQGDVEWQQAPLQAEELLRSADVVIGHNGKIDPRHRSLLQGKPFVTMAHNYMWNVDATFVQQGFPGVVVGQYQATLPEFTGWQAVPNPMPLWEAAFQPGAKQSSITICYTPSGKHETFPAGHRLYWHSKGYATTMRVLENLARRFPLHLEVIRDRQVSQAESLAMKRGAHIVIDECVTGSYHRNSLEGLAAGCVVVNGVGRLPAVADMFRHCAGGAPDIPFVRASLDDLEGVLTALIEQGPQALTVQGARNRAWMEEHWDFERQWPRFWESVVERALQRPTRKRSMVSTSSDIHPNGEGSMRHQIVAKELKEGLSVVVCHGGKERLPQLGASLANLRQCEGVSEIIIADMGSSPCAEDVARRWADKYLFVRNDDVFERARSLNTGTALAEYELVLWMDNDLIMSPDFIAKAVAEIRSRRLDYLIPYTSISYLSAPDSQAVMQGIRNPADSVPVKVFRPIRENSGAAGILRKSFVLAYGGMSEDFRGWGGEDDAWWYKAQLLGRAAVTQRQDQYLYHLFHLNSGAYGRGGQIANNPYYSKNVAVLKEMRSIKDQRLFTQRFPALPTRSGAWEKKQVLLIADSSHGGSVWPVGQMAQALEALYGLKVDCRLAAGGTFAWKEALSGQPPDSIAIFGTDLAMQFLSDQHHASLWGRAVIGHTWKELTAEIVYGLRRAGAVLCAGASIAQTLKQAGLRPWVWTGTEGESGTPFSAALALVQPLSIILGGATPLKIAENRVGETQLIGNSSNGDDPIGLPVWMYWEGECPDWIKQCQQTVSAHAAHVCLLSPQDLNKLRDSDRDIDLQELQVAHRADYIRAFLLARYGGLWVDCDCIVMQPLAPILDLLKQYDFIAHRERSGLISNGFIGSRPGGRIASTLYRRICEILRSRRPLGWTSLGGEPLTAILGKTDASWYEIECRRIQPICWSNPGAFFSVNSPAEHERTFDSRAICYMLSNTEVQRFQAANSAQNLLNKETLFSYLVGKALNNKEVMPSVDKRFQVAPNWQQIPFGMETMADLSPKRVLDIGMGLGRWGMLIREFCEESSGRVHREEWKVHLEGIAPFSPSVEEHQHFFYNGVHAVSGDGKDVIERMTGSWDLVLFGDDFEPCTRESRAQILNRALEIADYVLVNNSVAPESGPSLAMDGSPWRLADFFANDLLRFAVYKGHNGKNYGSFLLSRSDPKHLRNLRPMEEIFTRLSEQYVRVGDESVSGPGSSLFHTAEIRQRLPLLVYDLGVRSLLDAPCGDFNWMKHVALGIEEYIGIDVVPGIIAQNQKRFGGPNRKFITLDITKHSLPETDLILCRDCLVHFSYEDIYRALRTFKISRSKYLLTTTFDNLQSNTDIATGCWRPVNFRSYPFEFPEPVRIINEKCKEGGGKYSDKSLALWKLADIL